jgi:amino acid adenylation domain-containing protein/non-ribosomal peptide synthase protein (TIGR01720 family)
LSGDGSVERSNGFVGPRTPTEELLAETWARLLGLERVSVDDNFFDLGADSLLAMRVVAWAREALGVELDLELVFENPTVRLLADAVVRERAERKGAVAPPLRSSNGIGDRPLSFAQERLWFLEQLTPASAAYNIPSAFLVEGPLNREALAAALNEIVGRHETLHTTFVTGADGRPRQRIGGPAGLELADADLSELRPAGREREARRLAAEEALRPFDLAHDRLIRAGLVRMSPDEHVLFLTTHHIASDAWSMGILAWELKVLYQAYAAQSAPPLPPLERQYSDYADWQRRWLSGDLLERQLSYWRQALAGMPTLGLPTDHPRPPVATANGGEYGFTLSRRLSDAVVALGRGESATLYMTLMAAFQALLARWTGQADIPVGAPIAGRPHPELEGLIGFFVNTLVLRGDLSGDPSFRHLLAATRERALAAYQNQDLPFERLVAELDPERDLSRHPLVQVELALDNAPGSATVELGPGLKLTDFDAGTTAVCVDLELHVFEGDDGLVGSFDYNRDLFDHATIERLARHFERLLSAIVQRPDVRLSELELLDSADHQRLDGWNQTAADFPNQDTVHGLFERQVQRSPNATALVFDGQELSYADVNGRANQLAHELRALGVERETLVALCLERSAEMVIALLAVLKAGGAYLPLDPDYPVQRLSFMLADSGAPALVTQERLRDKLENGPATVVTLDDQRPGVARWPTENPVPRASSENRAYVIYTSGSSGQPKGVEVQHRSVVNFLVGMRGEVALSERDRMFAVTTLSFDIAVLELLGPLSVGAAAIVADKEVTRNGERLGAAIDESKATVMQATPATWRLLFDSGWSGGKIRALCGGEALPRDLAFRLLASTEALWNLYGPTETTIWSTAARVDHGDWVTVPIGRPIQNTQIHVLDIWLRPTPIGVAGDLYIGGDGLARGYLGQPSLTADRFIADPFGRPGSRMYRTGDIARYREDGSLEFLGRADAQVKIRGFRVEPGEIEAALATHPAVSEAVVVAREDLPGQQRLVGYFVSRSEAAPPSGAELRDWLRRSLPTYMLPTAFVGLESLPLTANGKVDREALPAPEGRRELASAPVAPRTATEELLAAIWVQVLGVERVGIDDNFFELGGDSLLSIQAIVRARSSGLAITARQLFEHQTVARLAALAEAAPPVTTGQGPVSGPVPLTPFQHWFFEAEMPKGSLVTTALHEAPADLELAELKEMVAEVVSRHDALRMRFSEHGGAWHQENLAEEERPVCSSVDLSDLHSAEDQLAALIRETEALSDDLDPSAGPLLRLALVDLGRGRKRVAIAIDHLVVDAISWRIFLEDLETAHSQIQRQHPIVLPPKTSSFKEWAERLEAHANSQAALDELDSWLDLEAGEMPVLPRDHAEGPNSGDSTDAVEVSLSTTSTGSLLREVPAADRTQVNEVLLAALAQSVFRWSGDPTLLIDVVAHGREPIFVDLDLSRTVGAFLSDVPLRFRLDEPDNPGLSLGQVKDAVRGMPNHGLGYGVLRYLSPEPRARGLGESAAEIALNYIGQLEAPVRAKEAFPVAPERVGRGVAPAAVRRYLIEVDAKITDGRLMVSFVYSRYVHDRATIERLADDFESSVEGLIAHCVSASAHGQQLSPAV